MACVELQKEVWGFNDAELVPLRLFVVAQKIGGQVLGAFEGSELVGFALASRACAAGILICIRTCWPCGRTIGTAAWGGGSSCSSAKDALARGFELIEWTFDPLEIKNAYLNMERLGAIARRYNINQYGTTSSPLQGGCPPTGWWRSGGCGRSE